MTGQLICSRVCLCCCKSCPGSALHFSMLWQFAKQPQQNSQRIWPSPQRTWRFHPNTCVNVWASLHSEVTHSHHTAQHRESSYLVIPGSTLDMLWFCQFVCNSSQGWGIQKQTQHIVFSWVDRPILWIDGYTSEMPMWFPRDSLLAHRKILTKPLLVEFAGNTCSLLCLWHGSS